jgi:hypothetical protein
LNPKGTPFSPIVFTDFNGWTNEKSSDPDDHHGDREDRDRRVEARAAVARGQALFNSRRIAIEGVKGLNDEPGVQTIAGRGRWSASSADVPSRNARNRGARMHNLLRLSV